MRQEDTKGVYGQNLDHGVLNEDSDVRPTGTDTQSKPEEVAQKKHEGQVVNEVPSSDENPKVARHAPGSDEEPS
jgi:hypothetical protein